MELADLFGALRRWWYLAVVVLLLAVGAGVGLSKVRGPSYVAVTSMVLVPPQSTVSGAATASAYAPSNPLLYLGSLSQSRDIILEALNSSEVADRLADRFPTADMAATPAVASSGPIVVLTVTARSSDEALAAMTYAGQQVPVVLDEIQNRLKVDAKSRVTAFALTADTKAAASHKSQLQLSILGGVGVAVVGLFLIAVWDHLIRTRSRNRTAAEPGSPAVPVGASGRDPVPPTRTDREGARPGAAGSAAPTRDPAEAVLAGSASDQR